MLLYRYCAIATLAIAGAIPLAGCSQSADAKSRGEAVYASCLQCHQASGAGSEVASAPNIAGLSADYIAGELTKFRSGARGASPDDATGQMMAAQAQTLASTADVKAVAAYVASLPPVDSPQTLQGDAGRGRDLYLQSCAACHGMLASGNAAMGAPRLAGRDDWYLVRELEDFRSGKRGADPRDPGSNTMQAMAATLPDEQSLRDVAVFLASLH
ncbi:MAG: c-type cytochrome [Cyanobacteria bacterium REEB65]|nr:c-type cytochrome [Cyanobacteria bacterium REEB65]